MLLLTDIGALCVLQEGSTPLRGKELAKLRCLKQAYLLVEGNQIAAFGSMDALPAVLQKIPATKRFSLEGRWVLPAFCDSHTHLVYAQARDEEYVLKLKGSSYAEIAAKGGGILQSAKKIASCSEDELFRRSWIRLTEAMALGTGAIELKSGYGLVPEEEKKLLRVMLRLKEKAPIPVRLTYLALHALPENYHGQADRYVEEVAKEMIPWVADHQAADYVDVFCEQGFFDAKACKQVLQAATQHGLAIKMHTEQLSACGGVEVGIGLGARSLDHLERLRPKDIPLFSTSNCIATLLPTVSFFLRDPYAPARALIDANAILALASDYNPGSSPGVNLQFVWALACTAMRMTPEEALHALTFNGAAAMDLQHDVGSIAVGKRANLLVTRKIPRLSMLPYYFSSAMFSQIMVAGAWLEPPPYTTPPTY